MLTCLWRMHRHCWQRQQQLVFDQRKQKGPGRDAVVAAYLSRKTATEDLLQRMTKLLRGESQEQLGVLQKEADATLKALIDLEPAARRMVGAAAGYAIMT